MTSKTAAGVLSWDLDALVDKALDDGLTLPEIREVFEGVMNDYAEES